MARNETGDALVTILVYFSLCFTLQCEYSSNGKDSAEAGLVLCSCKIMDAADAFYSETWLSLVTYSDWP